MPVTYPVALSAPKGGKRRMGSPTAPTAAPTAPTAAPTAPMGGIGGPFRALVARLPAPMRPLLPIALLLGAGYLAYRLGNRR